MIMEKYKQGVGSWDDDDAEIKESVPTLGDHYIMPFGKHKGKHIGQVPAAYLLWLKDNSEHLDAKIKSYIDDNIDSLNQEVSIRKT